MKAALLHEENPAEDNADIGLDEAFISIKTPVNENLSVILGRQYVPFGLHTSNMISDPLTLLISEINDSAATFSYSNGLTAHAYVMNGNTRKAQEEDDTHTDHASEFGVGFGFESEDFNVGLNWINSLAEAGDVVDTFGSPLEFDSYVPGVSLWATANAGAIELSGEYVTATKDYDAAAFSYNDEGARPSALSLEAKYDLGSNGAWLGVRLDKTAELLFLGAPESAVSFGYGQDLFENTSLAVEIYQANDYDEEDIASAFEEEAVAGSGESATGITLQVGVSF